jgi:hypothetical protein
LLGREPVADDLLDFLGTLGHHATLPQVDSGTEPTVGVT